MNNLKKCKEMDQQCMNPMCKTPGYYLESHHIVHRSLGGDNKLGNLITLCRNCHQKIENGQLDIVDDVLRYWIGWDLFRWKESLAKIISWKSIKN